MKNEQISQVTRSELQKLAQEILRANGVELGLDPRSEIQVAVDMGYLELAGEALATGGITASPTAEV